MPDRRTRLLTIKGALSSFNDLDPDMADTDYLRRQIMAARLTAKIIENTVDSLIAEEKSP